MTRIIRSTCLFGLTSAFLFSSISSASDLTQQIGESRRGKYMQKSSQGDFKSRLDTSIQSGSTNRRENYNERRGVSTSSPEPRQYIPIEEETGTPIDVCFSPNEGNYGPAECEQKIIDQIKTAQDFIIVYMYRLTSKQILNALYTRMQKNQIPVILVLDSLSWENYSQGRYTWDKLEQLMNLTKNEDSQAILLPINMNDLTQSNTQYASFHHKVLITGNGDGAPTVMIGSNNFTWAGDQLNMEDMVFLKDQATAINYINNMNTLIENVQDTETKHRYFEVITNILTSLQQ